MHALLPQVILYRERQLLCNLGLHGPTDLPGSEVLRTGCLRPLGAARQVPRNVFLSGLRGHLVAAERPAPGEVMAAHVAATALPVTWLVVATAVDEEAWLLLVTTGNPGRNLIQWDCTLGKLLHVSRWMMVLCTRLEVGMRTTSFHVNFLHDPAHALKMINGAILFTSSTASALMHAETLAF